MKVVTVGGGFLDIDGLGAGVAYAELLNLLGEPAEFVCTGKMNASVPEVVRRWKPPIRTHYAPTQSDRFIVVDNSAPKFLEPFVREEQIEEIIDHHLVHEQYWRDRGVKIDVEFIGACCTQIYERWQRASKLDAMSELSARLMMSGILDNTLNFQASITTERDKVAYADLINRANLSDGWSEQYFSSCQKYIEQNLAESMHNDTKADMRFPGYDTSVTICQIVVWDGGDLVQDKVNLLGITERYGLERSIDIISISENRTYFVTRSEGIKNFFETTLGVEFEGDTAVASRMWLRKEIMKKAIESNEGKT